MSGSFWERKLAGIAQPKAPAPPPQQGVWWQQPEPAPQPQQYGYPDPALRAQMPYQGPTGPNGMPDQEYINQLRRTPADRLSQQQMETIAEWELANVRKYNQSCPQCGSANFAPAGTVIASKRLGADKCFDCGASSSTYTSSPEPAVGGSKASTAPYRDVRQIDTGGHAGNSMYLKFRGVPAEYMPSA